MAVAKKPTKKAEPANKDQRIHLIEALEKERGSKVITYVCNTRANYDIAMALDVIRYVFEQLEFIKSESKGTKPKIDLFLHSSGGDGTVPWKLVTLIREYTDHFSVLVPHRAFSAATLTCLGANEVIMHPMGMLGPTDATVSNAFNPINQGGQRLGISVEDVTAYIQLVKEDAGIQHEDELVQAFNILAQQVHPLALGNVKRSISQSRMMARKLLGLHMEDGQAHHIDEIVDNLTSKLFYHGHPISRNEARDHINLKTVKNASAAVEKAMWNLYLSYEKEMEMTNPFDITAEFASKVDTSKTPTSTPIPGVPGVVAQGPHQKTDSAKNLMVYCESTHASFLNSEDYCLSGTALPTGALNVLYLVTNRGWNRIR